MMAAKDRQCDKRVRSFGVGEVVWVRNYANGPKWIKGVVEKLNGPASYEVLVNGNMVHRHVDQVRRCAENTDAHTIIKKDTVEVKVPRVERETRVADETKVADGPVDAPVTPVVDESDNVEEPELLVNPATSNDDSPTTSIDDIPEIVAPRRSGRIRNMPSYLSDYITWLKS